MADTLNPFVYWGQTNDKISLKIALRNIEDEQVNLTRENLSFRATGDGVKGNSLYGVSLSFYQPVDPENSFYRKTATDVEFQIKKDQPESWPRLTGERVKLPWLKIDFDKFLVDDESDEEKAQQSNFDKEMMDKFMEDFNKEKPSESKPFTIKLNYLVCYNLFQFIGFSYVIFGLLFHYITKGLEAKHTAFEAVGLQLMICQLAAFLEVLGRNFILFLLILQEPRLQEQPVVFYLILVWGGIELVRYPFYILQSMGQELALVTWLRYTLWIPLYPLGILLEGTLVFMAIPLFEETGFFSFSLPNTLNMAFYFPWILQIYPIILAGAGYFMLQHMYRQRKRRLGPALFSRHMFAKKSR
ncbi:hypothetical protein C0Q70_20046 [Pomacea canaliculata]|uniref:Very-long-chain (3R)-3-hydroxyacyl-CoA dehydratase n=1 Tax=Pomacea canaliculata TaxID=400727 RepID=A0A2T7NEG5_POMCA|nr:hypothetical protein C0Q70_20046 [Pomacea canaliculata]